jgi:Protein of unknown function DUF2834
MSDRVFTGSILLIAAVFCVYFAAVVIPPLVQDPDIVGAFVAGFANPYSSGYSADVFACWGILAAWVLYEAKEHSVKNGWICLLIGVVPGVAVGFAAYLLLRSRQLPDSTGAA